MYLSTQKNLYLRLLFFISFSLLLSSCVILHHTQIGEIDSKVVLEGRRFEILVSETGVNFQEAVDIGKAVAGNKESAKQLGDLGEAISMFQMGPRTGNPVFTDAYSDKIFSLIRKECPGGRVSGLISVRETAKYPVVSGEIVKVIGYCLRKGKV